MARVVTASLLLVLMGTGTGFLYPPGNKVGDTTTKPHQATPENTTPREGYSVCWDFYHSTDFLLYYNDPNNVNDIRCQYIVHVPQDVYLRVTDLQLQDCCDHLQIYDGYDMGKTLDLSTSHVGQFFVIHFTSVGKNDAYRSFRIDWNPHGPPTIPPPISSTVNPSATIPPRTDNHWGPTNGDCDKVTSSSSGVISSPNFNSRDDFDGTLYDNNLRCHYVLVEPNSSLLTVLRINEILLGKGDFLEITFTNPADQRQNVTLTGMQYVPQMIGRDFHILFTTDSSGTDIGFQFAWRRASSAYLTSNKQTHGTD